MARTSRPLALVTRPEPGAEALALALRQKGYDTLIDPLLAVTSCQGRRPPQAAECDAILFTSANAIRHLPAPDGFADKPAFAVGTATANLLRARGFANVIDCDGTARDLAARVLAHLTQTPRSHVKAPRLLLPTTPYAGHEIADTLGLAGCQVERWHVYKVAAAKSFDPATVAALAAGKIDCVCLLSARTARIFARLIRQLPDTDRPARGIKAYCLSNAVAAACDGLRFASVTIAERPTLQSLLEAL